MRHAVRNLPVALLLMHLTGCGTVTYYAQAVNGHLQVMAGARPIDVVERDPATSAALRERLALAREIRDFASRELALPDNGSYRRYADVGRPFVVWNVVIAPELSVDPLQHCFPIAGCVTYRGFYAEADARAAADSERAAGRDAHVGGVPAYSTLGWFDDPLLNTFIRLPEPELARLIFHELAHQVAYARGDTEFNESYASVVEEEGVKRWIAGRGRALGEIAAREAMLSQYRAARERQQQFIALLLGVREKLNSLYRSEADIDTKRRGKVKAFAELRADYEKLKASWGGFAGYDRFLSGDGGNALLASVATYNTLVPALTRLLASRNFDLAAFHQAVKELAGLAQDERRRGLAAIGG